MRLGDALKDAASEYRWLLDRGYPPKASLALVGDRHRLPSDERLMLFRGVASSAASAARRRKLERPAPGDLLLVDLYNVAFTIIHYLIGKPCFISSDGLLRDAGANYGRVAHDEELLRAFDLAARAIVELGPRRVEAFLDSPVSRSGEHAEAFRAALAGAIAAARGGPSFAFECSVAAVRSADGAICSRLQEAAGAEGRGAIFVLSSDSVLVDRAERVFDLAIHVIRSTFAEGSRGIPEFPGLFPNA